MDALNTNPAAASPILTQRRPPKEDGGGDSNGSDTEARFRAFKRRQLALEEARLPAQVRLPARVPRAQTPPWERVDKPRPHHTISKDQTASSDFQRALLLAADTGADKDFALKLPGLGLSEERRDDGDRLNANRPVFAPVEDLHISKRSARGPQAMTRRQTESRVFSPGLRSPSSVHESESRVVSPSSGTGHYTVQSNTEADMLVQQLMRKVQFLQEENFSLLEMLENRTVTGAPQVQVFHCISQEGESPRWRLDDEDGYGGDRDCFLDEPSWDTSRSNTEQTMGLRGHSLILDAASYVRNHPDIAMVVCNYYSPEHRPSSVWAALRRNEPLPNPEPAQQTIRIVSPDLLEAFQTYVDQHPSLATEFRGFSSDDLLRAPYYWRYHSRESALDLLGNLTPHQSNLLRCLFSWIDENYGKLYEVADSHIKRKVVSPLTLPFMYCRGKVLVQRNGESVTSCLVTSGAAPDYRISPFEDGKGDRAHGAAGSGEHTWSWILDTSTYVFDGCVRKKESILKVELQSRSAEDAVDISDVDYVPLDMMDSSVRELLARRGATFWSCRKQKMVSYVSNGEALEEEQGEPGRYIVDFLTYNKLHSAKAAYLSSGVEMPRSVFDQDYPPPEPELFLLPGEVVGFDLRHKKWKDLKVDYIQEVSWNTEAFQHLVADEQTKELIQALVTNQLAAEKGTDIIANKGNGLIMLLHGPPGTGKTFTAESVAEMARKPLYPVTCGDIGTKPEQVESYLESVLHLGKIWGCVVLLDEAEVFLEQRSLLDLDRNALVSVFLRALEYYDGILILTSNRVGTFDEAFKSRIQLALRYHPLDEAKRRQIWENFFARLQGMDDMQIDFGDIARHLGDLAEYPMNGRQIRNAITTARQLAQFKRKTMTFPHLKHAIEVTGEFDKYLRQLNDGASDEVFARRDHLR